MSTFNWKFRREPENYPEQICFVGDFDTRSKDAAKKFNLPITSSEPNNNKIIPQPRTIYVLNEFENNDLFEALKRTSDTWILGITALVELSSNCGLEFRSQPTYCTSMYGMCFYIYCPENAPLMTRMARLIKWMGGMFCISPNMHTTHMVTTSVRAKHYTYCITFNIPILSTQWVEYCWSKRNYVFFDANSCMSNFKLKAFQDLYISFEGYISEDFKDMKRITESNGGTVVPKDDCRCTHLVLEWEAAKVVSIGKIPPHILFVVTSQWFWTSIEDNYRNYEWPYQCFNPQSIEEVTWLDIDVTRDESDEEEEVENASQTMNTKHELGAQSGESARVSHVSNSSTSSKSEQEILETRLHLQDTKRKLVFEELCQTECNYIRCLDYLISVKCSANSQVPPILDKAQEKVIFGNLENIQRIHIKILKDFSSKLENWRNNILTSQVLLNLENDLKREYVIYSMYYEEGQKMLRNCERKNLCFKKFIEDYWKENNISENFRDLFIRPIQRFCSIYLLLNEIKKHTRDDNPDKEILTKATLVVTDILKSMNEGKDKIDKLQELFNIYNTIINFPPDLMASHRDFIIQFSAQQITNSPQKNSNLGNILVFFLFNDVLELTKLRSKIPMLLKSGTTLLKEARPYKHITSIPLSMILNVFHLQSDKEDEENMFGFSIKDPSGEKKITTICYLYLDENPPLNDILIKISNQISASEPSRFSEDCEVKTIPSRRLSIQTKVLKNQKKNDILNKCCQAVKILTFSNKRQKNVEEKKSAPVRRSISCSEIRDLNVQL